MVVSTFVSEIDRLVVLVIRLRVLAGDMLNPEFPPTKFKVGIELVPGGTLSDPDREPPVSAKSSDACPVKLAVIVPAIKLPLPSLWTIVLGVLIAAATTLRLISSVVVVADRVASTANDLKWSVSPITSLKTRPLPAPSLAPLVDCGKVNCSKIIAPEPMIEAGLPHKKLEPPYTVPAVTRKKAFPAAPLLKSTGLVQAPAVTTQGPFSIGSVWVWSKTRSGLITKTESIV